MSAFEVIKFGGTSLAGAEKLLHAVDLLANEGPEARVVVCSAMAGVTDALLGLASAPATESSARWKAIRQQHELVGAQLANSPSHYDVGDLDRSAREALAEPRSSARTDALLSLGEKLAVRLFAIAASSRGILATPLESDDFLETNAHFGCAQPIGDWEPAVRAAVRSELVQRRSPILTGFVGRAPCGRTTTLGRGTSDWTAGLVARAIGARRVILFTDVPGVCSADPDLVENPTTLPSLTYDEALALTLTGSEVIHPATLRTLRGTGAILTVRGITTGAARETIVKDQATRPTPDIAAVSHCATASLTTIASVALTGHSAAYLVRPPSAQRQLTLLFPRDEVLDVSSPGITAVHALTLVGSASPSTLEAFARGALADLPILALGPLTSADAETTMGLTLAVPPDRGLLGLRRLHAALQSRSGR